MKVEKLISVVKVKLRQVRDGGRVKFKVDRITRPADVYDAVRAWYRGLDREALGVLALDAQNQPVAFQIVSLGGLNTTRTHPREIFKLLVLVNACGFCLTHNHPSNCAEASQDDIQFTRAIQRAGELMGIELFDHLVITDNGFTSFRERGLI